MQRILYFHHGGAIGGAPLSLLYLIQQLDRSHYEPIVVSTRPGPVHDLYRAQGIPIYLADEIAGRIDDLSHTELEWYGLKHLWPLPGRILRLPASIRHARQIVTHFHPDLIHLNSSTLAAAALGAQGSGIPLIWHIREPLAAGYTGLRRRWLRTLIDRSADRVVSISHFDASRLVASERLRVIYNFIDFERFDRAISGLSLRAELGIKADQPIVLMLGGVAQPKGTLTLIEAMPRILATRPDALLLIAGPAPAVDHERGWRGLARTLLGADAYGQAALARIEALGLGTSIRLLGVRADVPQLLAASDLLAFPSSVPHFARPAIEAAAMATPVVASDLGGPNELVLAGRTGLLVPPNAPDPLAEAIVTLLADPQRRAAMGEAAYQHARAHFDARRNAQATIALYAELLGS